MAFVSSMAMLISACSTAPKVYMARIDSIPANKVANSMIEAVKSGVIKQLSDGDKINSRIAESDPAIILEIGTSRFRSNFKLYSFTANQSPMSYTINLRSLGNFLGFRKTEMIPLIFIIDESGKVIDQTPKTFGQESFGIACSGVWEGAVPKIGRYFVIVASDNSQNGERIRDGVGTGGGGSVLATSYPVYSTPYAKFVLKFKLTTDSPTN